MCCLVTALLILGPRATIFVWWLLRMNYWQHLFPGPNGVAAVLGFLFLPWTTLMYAIVGSHGVVGIEWLLILIGLLADLGTGGGAYRNRDRVRDRW